MRRAARVDANHAAVVAALRSWGCSVVSLAALGNDVPDLLVGARGRNVLVEVKDGTAKDKRRRNLRASQRKWAAMWSGAPVVVVRSTEEAYMAVICEGTRDHG